MKKLLLLMLALSFITFAQAPILTGSLTENAIITDLEGKTYDLYSLLEQGKYILVHKMSVL